MKQRTNLLVLVFIALMPVISAAQFKTIPLTEGKEHRKFPSMATSINGLTDDGVIVSWLESKHNGSLVIQKVDNIGNILWTTGGVIADSCLGSEFFEDLDYPMTFTDYGGGAIVVYRKWDEIFCTSINSKGVPDRYPTNVSSYYDGLNYSSSAVQDKKGNVFIVWENFYMGDFNIHGQRIDPQGQKIWNSGEEVSLCRHPADQRKPELALSGSGNLVVSWLDTRDIGLPDSGSYDAYGLLVSYTGEIVGNESGSRLFLQRVSNETKNAGSHMGNVSIIGNTEKTIDYKHLLINSGTEFYFVADNIKGEVTKDITIYKFTSKLELLWQRQVKTGIISEGPYALSDGQSGLVVVWTENSEFSGISVLGIDGSGKPLDGRSEERNAYCFGRKIKPVVSLDHSFNPLSINEHTKSLLLPWLESDLGNLIMNDFCLTDESAGCTNVRSVNHGLTQEGHTSTAILDGNPVIAYNLTQDIYLSIRDMPGDHNFHNMRIPEGKIANYPNPFNPSTSINFDVPTDGFVRLSIYDMAGRRLVELLNGFMKKGVYSIRFDGSNLASGTYVYQLVHDGKQTIGKMMLTK